MHWLRSYLNIIRHDPSLLVCVMLVGYAVSVSASAVLTSPQVIGADYYFHIEVAKFYAYGDFSGAWNYVLTNIFFPYPPVFHLMLVPSVWLGAEQLFARIAEVLFMPLTYILILWLMIKHSGGGSKAAAITGLTLLGCWSFMDGALQVRPESLDLLVYPLIVASLIVYKRKWFMGLTVLALYNHGPAAFSIIYGLAVKKLKCKKWQKTLLLTSLIILPVLILSALYIDGAMLKWGGYSATENPQEAMFWNQPFPFVFGYMGATLIGLPFLFKKNKSNFESLLTWGFVGSLIMFPIWVDRWMHYVSIPLACLAGLGVTGLKPGKKRLAVTVLIISLFMIYYAMWIMTSAGGGWWQPGD